MRYQEGLGRAFVSGSKGMATIALTSFLRGLGAEVASAVAAKRLCSLYGQKSCPNRPYVLYLLTCSLPQFWTAVFGHLLHLLRPQLARKRRSQEAAHRAVQE